MAIDLASNLIGRWSFNNGIGTSVTDVSGFGRTLLLSGGPAWAAAGKFGGALILDGVDDRGQCSIPFGTSTTFAAWVKFSAFPANQCLVATYSANVQPSNEWSTVLGIDSAGHVVAYATDGSPRRASSQAAITLNAWYHVAGTFKDGVSVISYINGIADGISILGTQYSTFTGGPFVKVGGSTIGTTNTSFNNFGAYQIDDLCIYSRALSAAEMLALYYRGNVNRIASNCFLACGASIQETPPQIFQSQLESPYGIF